MSTRMSTDLVATIEPVALDVQRHEPSTPSATSALLTVEDLSVEGPGDKGNNYSILNNVSFEVQRGQTVGILGESGCGKSTLARALMGILPRGLFVRGGRITLGTDEMTGASENFLRNLRGNHISLIHQEAEGALHPLMRVNDQIAEIFRAHRAWSRRKCLSEARSTLAKIFGARAESIGRSFPHELSGGQRQRVLIAQAIACHPQIVIADEPTASLDASTQSEILALLRKLKQQEDMSLILITHNPAILMHLADQIVVMYAGRIVEFGIAEKVFSNPLHPYTRALLRLGARELEAHGEAKSRLATIPGQALVTTSGGRQLDRACDFEPRCEQRMAVCRSTAPHLDAVNPDQRVRCLLYGG